MPKLIDVTKLIYHDDAALSSKINPFGSISHQYKKPLCGVILIIAEKALKVKWEKRKSGKIKVESGKRKAESGKRKAESEKSKAKSQKQKVKGEKSKPKAKDLKTKSGKTKTKN